MRPETSHTVDTSDDGRQISPSAARNKAPMLEVIRNQIGLSGAFMEIASGTGEHIAHFAANLPEWQFQPTEADPNRLKSIAAWTEFYGAENIAPPLLLDATTPWAADHSADAIHIANVFHLITVAQATAILEQCAMALSAGGRLMIYGPFMRDGQLTSNGDATFHANIQAADPARGYKNDKDMLELLGKLGLVNATQIEMPANNLYLIAQKP